MNAVSASADSQSQSHRKGGTRLNRDGLKRSTEIKSLPRTAARTEDGSAVKLPPDVLAAKYKMERVDAALRADIMPALRRSGTLCHSIGIWFGNLQSKATLAI
jgi:hypothetical protein